MLHSTPKLLVFPPKSTDVCGARMEKPCFRPSQHPQMVPRFPVGYTTHACPHPNCPPLCSRSSVFKLQDWLSTAHPPTIPPLLLEWIPKCLVVSHGGPMSWVLFILFDHRVLHVFPSVRNALQALPCGVNSSDQLNHHLLKEAFSGLPDTSGASYTIAPSFITGDVAFISVVL